jgi:hypothetical protein
MLISGFERASADKKCRPMVTSRRVSIKGKQECQKLFPVRASVLHHRHRRRWLGTAVLAFDA